MNDGREIKVCVYSFAYYYDEQVNRWGNNFVAFLKGLFCLSLLSAPDKPKVKCRTQTEIFFACSILLQNSNNNQTLVNERNYSPSQNDTEL
jgi:hypothetical protein